MEQSAKEVMGAPPLETFKTKVCLTGGMDQHRALTIPTLLRNLKTLQKESLLRVGEMAGESGS